MTRSAAPSTSTQALELAARADERDHDLRVGVEPFLHRLGGRLEDRADLHLVDLGVRDAEPAAAVAEHRVGLREGVRALPDLLDRDAEVRGGLLHRLVVVRQELVQGRIEQADRDGRSPISRKIPRKSSRCIGRIFASAARRCSTVSARIISRTATMRFSSKNMCSVRQRPMPSAPKSRATRASFGVSALARTPRRRRASAHSRMRVNAR